MLNAVIFDLDGVLVSTDEMHFEAWRKIADELGMTGFTRGDNLRQRGVGRMESLEIVLERSDKSFSPEQKEEIASRKNGYYVEMLETLSEASVLPGALETLKLLRLRGVPLAVGSASRNARLILERTGLLPYLDALADGYDATRSKPDPQVFLAAAGKLNIKPEACLVVEDADAGIQAGAAAGMKTLGVGPAALNPLCDFAAKSLADPCLDWDKILK